MPESFKVNIEEVPAQPDLGPDQGWVGMTVQFIVDAFNGGSENFVFGRARFAPGQSAHQWHRHENAEEFAYILKGEGIVLDGDNEIPVKEGDVAFHAKGAWHGFKNTSDSEEAIMIWGWAGASSKATAGYELRYPHAAGEQHTDH